MPEIKNKNTKWKKYLLQLTPEQQRLFKTRTPMMRLTIKELIILAVYELVEKGMK